MEVNGARHTPESLLEYLATHFDKVSPSLLARFMHEDGRMRNPRVGDTYHIQMLLLRPRTSAWKPATPWPFACAPCAPTRKAAGFEYRVRSSNALDRLTYLFGVSFAQRLTWEITMRRLAHASGGRIIRNGQSTEEHAWPLDPSFPRGTLS